MKTEEIILLAFVGLLIIGVPLLLWSIDREKRKEAEEQKAYWANKNKERLK